MNQLNTIRQERQILEKHKTDIAANRNFHYKVEEIHMRKIDLHAGEYVTNCLTCNRTCHYPCAIPDDKDKRGSAAMSNGSCTVCPNKCDWSMHKNNSFRFGTYPVTVRKTYAGLKQKYEIAQKEEQKAKICYWKS
jgi:MinD superfamily P-loop ATPase